MSAEEQLNKAKSALQNALKQENTQVKKIKINKKMLYLINKIYFCTKKTLFLFS